MAFIKGPKSNEPEPQGPDARMSEGLMRRSLEINKALKGTDSTEKTLEGMREMLRKPKGRGEASHPQPASESKPQGAANAPATPSGDGDRKRRADAMILLLQQKEAVFSKEAAGLEQQRLAIETQERALRERTVQEIVELMRVVWSDGDPIEAAAALQSFAPLLKQLGISERDLIGKTRAKP